MAHPSESASSSSQSSNHTSAIKPTESPVIHSFPQPPTFQPRLKQYVALTDYKAKGIGKWKTGELVEITNEQAYPLVATKIIMPLIPAMKAGYYPPSAASNKNQDSKPTLVERLKTATSKRTAAKKQLAHKLRAKVQAAKTKSSSKQTTKPKSARKKTLLAHKLRAKVQAAKTKSEAEKAAEAKITQLKASRKT